MHPQNLRVKLCLLALWVQKQKGRERVGSCSTGAQLPTSPPPPPTRRLLHSRKNISTSDSQIQFFLSGRWNALLVDSHLRSVVRQHCREERLSIHDTSRHEEPQQTQNSLKAKFFVVKICEIHQTVLMASVQIMWETLRQACVTHHKAEVLQGHR